MSDRAGICQVCGERVEAYTAEATRLEVGGRAKRRKILPPPTAEPCGHEQPRAIVWPAETPTFPPQG